MAQFVQLQSKLSDFTAAGIGLVGLTYDAPETQQTFVQKNSIEYPFLSDIDAFTVKALGILDQGYAPGDGAYGIPYPGIFIVDANRKIVGKVFIDGYSKRVTAESVLETAKGLLR
ncbi:MAG: redoxin domain-containing protein [Pseudomonadales bacterium]